MRAAALAVAALAVAGCGLGPGRATGEVALTVTRDFGGQRLLRASEPRAAESETVIRLLERHARIETRYGGRFVQSIDGLAGRQARGRRFDWLFYVNGIESPVGAAEARLHAGDRVWWDYREWTAALRVPAVVGSWPEPFLHGSGGRAFPVRIDCLGESRACREVLERLDRAGVSASIGFARARVGHQTLRILVGPWRRLREDAAARLVERGPDESGVFAGFEPPGLVLYDGSGGVRRRLAAGAGLVAAVRRGEDPPTWLITGTDPKGVGAAVRLLDAASLRDRYAVAVDGRGRAIPVP